MSYIRGGRTLSRDSTILGAGGWRNGVEQSGVQCKARPGPSHG